MFTSSLGLQNYKELIESIQNEYDALSQHYSSFQNNQKLQCLNGCGRCCFKPEIYVSPIEMLPLAMEILERGDGEKIYEKCLENKDLKCIFLNVEDEKTYKASCSEYYHRPLICRTFGVSGRHNKYNQIEYSVCKLIKEEKHEAYANLLKNMSIDLESVPFIDMAKTHIAPLDPRFLEEEVQINEAMRIMLEKLLFLKNYES